MLWNIRTPKPKSVLTSVNPVNFLRLRPSALQPLKSGTLPLYLSVPVPVLIPSVVTSRPTTASRPSTPLNSSPLAPQIRLLLTAVRVYKLDLLTYYGWSRRHYVFGCPSIRACVCVAGRKDLRPASVNYLFRISGILCLTMKPGYRGPLFERQMALHASRYCS